MNRPLLLTGAALLAFGSAAIAQTSAPATDAPAATSTPAAPDAGMAAAQPSGDATGAATATDTATPTTQGMATQAAPGGDTPASPPAAGATAAADTVQKDWAKYDPKNSGSLTPLEFGSWLMASREQDMTAQVMKTQTGKQKNLPAVKVLNATASDFAKADTDHDRKVSPAEMTAYLSS